MYFIGGAGLGGWGALSADNTPKQRKTPLNPPPKPPLFLNLALGGGLSMISDFRETHPPLISPSPPHVKLKPRNTSHEPLGGGVGTFLVSHPILFDSGAQKGCW